MQARTNEDIIRIVMKWQSSGFVARLTCRLDSDHAPLVPIERDGKVILGCPTCGTAQADIPDDVLFSEDILDAATRLRAVAEREAFRHARFTYVLMTLFTFGTFGAIAGSFVDTRWSPYVGLFIGLFIGKSLTRLLLPADL